ncbi:MAG TPA: glycosyltransferase [Pyrinomonadaceae bacterium]|nr:glycosyltransferase [Pyrinomonadaceae bacterium]
MPTRILHVVTSLTSGGAERQLVDVVCNTSKTEFEHVVCHLRPQDFFAEQIRRAGQRVVGLNLTGKYLWLAAARRLVPVIREVRPDCVHTWLFDADLSARLAHLGARGVPLITSLQAPNYDPQTVRVANWSPIKINGLRWLDKVSARWSNPSFVACSNFVRQSTMARLGVAASRIRVIYNSVDPNTLRCEPGEPPALRRSLEIPEDAFLYVTVGRLEPPKGHAYLVRAFAEVAATRPRAYLAIVGEGPLASDLKGLAAQLGVADRLRLLGRRKDVGACLEMSDAYVFPTLFEGFGIALVEAMFKGLPSAASRVGPIPEIIEDGVSGLLFTPGSVEELRAAMETLYDDPARRRSLAEKGFSSARGRFHSELTIPQWESLYREVARRATGTVEAVRSVAQSA